MVIWAACWEAPTAVFLTFFIQWAMCFKVKPACLTSRPMVMWVLWFEATYSGYLNFDFVASWVCGHCYLVPIPLVMWALW